MSGMLSGLWFDSLSQIIFRRAPGDIMKFRATTRLDLSRPRPTATGINSTTIDTISVDSDPWRGIGCTFYGRHTITVSAGHSYGVGTLSFRG